MTAKQVSVFLIHRILEVTECCVHASRKMSLSSEQSVGDYITLHYIINYL